jgi:hypothetical protein
MEQKDRIVIGQDVKGGVKAVATMKVRAEDNN